MLMNRWMHSGLIAFLIVGLGISGAACGAKKDTSKDDKSSDSKDDKKKDDKKKDDKDAKADKDKKKDKKVDVNDLLKDDDSNESAGALKIRVPKRTDENVPSLGGDEPAPTGSKDSGGDDNKDEPAGNDTPAAPAQPKKNVEWFSVGDASVPNPGWTKSGKEPVFMLASPDSKAVLVFIPFKDEAQAEEIVKKSLEGMKAKDMKWSNEPKQVTIGHDHLPAYIGTGHALVGDAQEKMKLLFAEVNTGKPLNLLVVGIADEKAPESDLTDGENILTSIKLPVE
jgi:hypothetical protein